MRFSAWCLGVVWLAVTVLASVCGLPGCPGGRPGAGRRCIVAGRGRSSGRLDGSGPVAARVDTTVAHIARVYDYWLGGKDNFAVDRIAAERVIAAHPDIVRSARGNRAFLGRAVRYLVGEAGVRQFLDIGTGPAPGPGRVPDVRSQSLPLLMPCASAGNWRSSALAPLLRQPSATDWDMGSGKLSSSSFRWRRRWLARRTPGRPWACRRCGSCRCPRTRSGRREPARPVRPAGRAAIASGARPARRSRSARAAQ